MTTSKLYGSIATTAWCKDTNAIMCVGVHSVFAAEANYTTVCLQQEIHSARAITTSIETSWSLCKRKSAKLRESVFKKP